jgi:hypothetical protein
VVPLLLVNGLVSCGAGDDDRTVATVITTPATRGTVSSPSTNLATTLVAAPSTATALDDGLDVIVARDPDGRVPADTPVTCDGFRTFPFSALADAVPVADSGLPEVQAALDQALSEAGLPWPQDDWLVLSRSDEQVLVIYVDADTVGFMDFGFRGRRLESEGGSLGDRCTLRTAMPAGLGEVEWQLDPAFSPPDADTTALHLLATERDCASGEPMGDRMLGPQIVETDDSVLIAFAATPPSVPEG